MDTERSELERRRAELTRALPELNEKSANAYRHNSDALALDRAGVRHAPPQKMVRLAETEAAADKEIRDAQRELRDIDAEIACIPRRGIWASVTRAVRRSRADR